MLISYRAGFTSMCLTTPMWTVKTRMALFQEYDEGIANNRFRSMQILRKVVTEMYQQEGI